MEQSLRAFLMTLREKPGELVTVKKEVSPLFELPGVIKKLSYQGKHPAVLFEKVRGTRLSVVSNIFASRSRIALSLGVEENDLNATFRIREDKRLVPEMISKGPVKEVILTGDQIDLSRLPIVYHHEKDGGPYITCGAMVMKDPDTGIRNIGMYRNQVKGKNRLGVHFAEVSHSNYIFSKYQKSGKPMPVAITIGCHPLFYLGCLSFVPVGIDEYEVVGGLMQEPLRLVKTETGDLEVPAEAEIVLEGEVDPGEVEMEGPFGEFTKVYGKEMMNPVVKINAITMRQNPLYQDVISGDLEQQLLGGTPRLSYNFKMVRTACPTVQDVFMPPSGNCRFICYVSIKKRLEGEAKNAICAIFATDPFVKYVVIVDEEVNIFDSDDILHAIANRLSPSQNVFVIHGAKGSPLDPTAQQGYLVTKVGIDATRPLQGGREEVTIPHLDEIDLSTYF
jgi:2,5-furandicarboxylate decarboxylase 1